MVSAKTICGSKPDMNVFEQMSCATTPVITRNARSRPTPVNTAAEITRIDKSQISFRNIRFVSPRSVRNECRVDPRSVHYLDIKTADWLRGVRVPGGEC